jgi:hypothetical protein
MNDANLAKVPQLALVQILFYEGRDLFWREGVKIERVFDGQHYQKLLSSG